MNWMNIYIHSMTFKDTLFRKINKITVDVTFKNMLRQRYAGKLALEWKQNVLKLAIMPQM